MSAGTQDPAAHIDPNKLESLLQQYGIGSEFIQFSGEVAQISLTNRLHILDTMGIAIDSAEQVDALIDARQLSSAIRMLPPVVYRDPGNVELEVIIGAENSAIESSWHIESENGDHFAGKFSAAGLKAVREFTASGRYYSSYVLPTVN